MLHASIITACIPSIKRFLADIQSGLMAAGISEYYETAHSGGKTYANQSFGYAKGTGIGSRLAKRLGVSSTSGSAMRSRNEKDSRIDNVNGREVDLEELHGRKARKGGQAVETTESVKGLTMPENDNVIVQTIDYKVEYEDARSGSSSREDEIHGYVPHAR